MGQQASHPERPDGTEVDEDSPFPEIKEHHSESEEGSPGIPNPSPDFAFSSQVPHSARHDRLPRLANRRNTITKVERPSPSPEHPVIVKSEPVYSSDGPSFSLPAATLLAKTKKHRAEINGDVDNMAGPAAAVEGSDDVRPQSSMDLDSSPPSYALDHGGAHSGEDTLNGTSQLPRGSQELDTEDLRRQEKRERREHRRAKKVAKAEKLKLASLGTDPNFGQHEDSDLLAEAPEAQQDVGDAEEDESEPYNEESAPLPSGKDDSIGLAKSSKKRKRQSHAAPEPDPEPVAVSVAASDNSTGDDAEMEDPNQLPTPDDEIHTNDLAFLPNGNTDIAEPVPIPFQSSSMKRKSRRDSSKKSRKKRKHLSEEQVNASDEVGLGENASISQDQTTADAAARSTSKKRRAKRASHVVQDAQDSAADEPSRFGDFAQNLYAQRYNSQKATPNKGKDILLPVSSRFGLQDDSPTVARLQRRRSQDHSIPSNLSGEATSIKHEPADEDDEDIENMNVDAELEDEADGDVDDMDPEYEDHDIARPDVAQSDEQDEDRATAGSAHAGADADAANNNTDDDADISMENTDNHARKSTLNHQGEEQTQLAPNDMGVDFTGSQEAYDDDQAEDSDSVGDALQIPRTLTKEAAHPSMASSKKNSVTRHYGSKTSTGKKRYAKPSYLDREQEGIVKAFAELPSPAVAAASRKERAKQPPTVAGPSSAPQVNGSGRQPKISSRMSEGVTSSAATPSRNMYVSKKPQKTKDPKPEEERKGAFSETEIRNIDGAIQRWRSDHDVPEVALNDMIHLNPQIAKTSEFWDHVHATVPQRKRQKIINQCRKKYHNFVARGSWTKEQHEELKLAYEIHGNKYRTIANQINRHPEDVRDRIRNYVICGDNRRSDAWDAEEEARLIDIIEDALKAIRGMKAEERNSRRGLQGDTEEQLVDWLKVSESMNHTRSRLQCKMKWKKLRAAMEGGNIDGKSGRTMPEIIAQARDDVASMHDRDRYLVAKSIRECGAKTDNRIPWAKLRASEVGGKWSRPALMLIWSRMRRSIPDWKIMSVPEITRKLCSTFQETGELNVPAEEDLDLDAEYHEIEQKVGKIFRSNRKSKTPHYAIKSDEDGEDDEALEDEPARSEAASGEEVFGDADIAARDASIELGLDQINISEDREIDESVVGSPKSKIKPDAANAKSSNALEHKKRRFRRKAQMTEEQSTHDAPETDSHAASGSSYEPNEVPAETLKTMSNKSSKSSTRSIKRRGKGKSRTAKRPNTDEDAELDFSSDTDAENAEDIPARI